MHGVRNAERDERRELSDVTMTGFGHFTTLFRFPFRVLRLLSERLCAGIAQQHNHHCVRPYFQRPRAKPSSFRHWMFVVGAWIFKILSYASRGGSAAAASPKGRGWVHRQLRPRRPSRAVRASINQQPATIYCRPSCRSFVSIRVHQ